MRKYSITEVNKVQTLMRHGVRAIVNDGLPTNAELQFWQERESYRKAFEAASRILWMAAKYADGESTDQEGYDAAMKEIRAARSECDL